MVVFGTKRVSDNLRRYTYVYIEVAKKNGKSTLLSALSLYMLGFDGEPGAEIYGCAGDKDQARLVFNDAKTMVELDSALIKKFKPQRDHISHPASGSVYRVVSAEAYTKHGPNLHAIMFDEVHVQPNSELYETTRKGMIGRRQPLMFLITTAGVVGTFAETIHDYAVNVSKGAFTDDRWYVKIYCADKDDDIFLQKTWRKANPGLGTSLSLIKFKQEVQEIKNDPTKKDSFRRLHLNIWTSTTTSWKIADLWDDCNIRKIDVEKLKGRKCYGGCDFAAVDDMVAFVLIFEPDDDDIIDIVPYFWVPNDTVIDRAKRGHVHFKHWKDEGLVLTCPGGVIDDNQVANDILQIVEGHTVMAIGFDAHRSAVVIPTLEADGLKCEAFKQAPLTMGVPMREIEKDVMNKRLNHGGNPILRWQVSNVQIYEDREFNQWIQKKKSTGKIDGFAALANAVCAYLHFGDVPENNASDYGGREITFL